MRLAILTREDLRVSTEWRNNHMETLRTPIMLNSTMQNKFYEDVICNRDSPHRYWVIRETRKELKEKNTLTWDEEVFVGVGGLINISWENRNAEISLIIDDRYHRQGLGEKAVDLLVNQGFLCLNLQNIHGEVYYCNVSGLSFWKKMIKKYSADSIPKPEVKYYMGKYWDSLYFTINKEGI